MTQRWEYMVLELICQRGPLGGIIRWYWHDEPGVSFSQEERMKALARVQEAGQEGWELTAVCPMSLEGAGNGMAGATSILQYTFKRSYET